MEKQSLFIRHIALPQDHGSWVFLLSPLLIGLFAGGRWTWASIYLIVAALAAFLIRQPVTVAVKALSGRRARRDLAPAGVWILIYAVVALAGVFGLVQQGYAFVLLLALPAAPVFAWHLWLVSRRQERRQVWVEVLGSGVLALAAPAALWIGRGGIEGQGWLLFVLAWLQSAASIVHAYLRLEQRVLPAAPTPAQAWRMGQMALIFTGGNLLLVLLLAALRLAPPLLALPYALQFGETMWGVWHPAVGYKPTAIGFRQLAVSSLFTLLFILAWGIK